MNALGDLVGYGSDDSEEENEEKELAKEKSRIDAAQDDGLATVAVGKERNLCCDQKRFAQGNVLCRSDEDKTSRNEEIISFLPSASDLLGPAHGHKRHRPASGIATHRIVEQAPSKIPKNLRTDKTNSIVQSRENEALKNRPVAIGLVPPQVERGRANVSTYDPSIFTSQTQRSMHQRCQNS